jgi:hypothetical protein
VVNEFTVINYRCRCVKYLLPKSCLLFINFLQDAPDSPKDDGVPPGSLVAPQMASVTPMEGVETGGPGEMRSRHLLYTTHFPLPHVWKTLL